MPVEGNEALAIHADRIAEISQNRLGPVRRGGGWLWWQPLNSIPAFDTNAKMWLAMRDGSLANQTIAQADAALGEAMITSG